MSKIYCKDCKHCRERTSVSGVFNCYHSICFGDDYYGPKRARVKHNDSLNKGNNCPYYEIKEIQVTWWQQLKIKSKEGLCYMLNW